MLLLLLTIVFRMIVLPVEFEDRGFAQTQDRLHAEVAEVQRYFDRQYGGTQSFRFDLAPAVRLPRPLAWYGANFPGQRDLHLGDAVREAGLAASEAGVDLRSYDMLCLLYPGPGEDNGGGEDDIWPQLGRLSAHGIDRYIACPAGRPGILAHEFGHALGLSDLYDTDGEASGGTTRGLWGISLMDEGCKGAQIPDFTAVEYEVLGLGRCDTLPKGSYKLPPLLQGHRYAKILTDRTDECFLFEAREGGLLVYHLDRSDAPAGYCERWDSWMSARERWENDAVNDCPDHPCARIIPARSDAASVAEARFPQAGISSFGSDSPVPMRSWSGKSPGLALTGIRTEADGSVSFDVIEPVALTGLTVYQDAAVIRWQTAGELVPRGFELRWTDGTDSFSREMGPEARVCTLEGLRPQTLYRFSLTVRCAEDARFSVDESLTTKVYRDGSYPYIYLNGAMRNSDGSFPAGSRLTLRVFNAIGAQQVRWFFDGEPIVPEADGSSLLTRPGTLRAQIFYADGHSESIFKTITVR